MASLRIPELFRSGIALIATLEEYNFQALLSALKGSSTARTARALSSEIGQIIPSIPDADRRSIISSVAAMQSVQKNSHASVPKFVDDVWDALEADSPELIENADREVLISRMGILLNEVSIHLTSIKASELRSEVERTFCGARVLTDLRTVFSDDAKKTPALTMMHTLELMFHDDTGRHREFYVSVDKDDLLTIKQVIERALEKNETLTDVLGKTEFELLD